MQVLTGYNVNTIVLSLDSSNNPYSGATFTTEMFQNGIIYTGITLNVALIDPVNAVFNMSWSASTYGDYQFYAYNNATGTIFTSDIVTVAPSVALQANIYLGL